MLRVLYQVDRKGWWGNVEGEGVPPPLYCFFSTRDFTAIGCFTPKTPSPIFSLTWLSRHWLFQSSHVTTLPRLRQRLVENQTRSQQLARMGRRWRDQTLAVHPRVLWARGYSTGVRQDRARSGSARSGQNDVEFHVGQVWATSQQDPSQRIQWPRSLPPFSRYRYPECGSRLRLYEALELLGKRALYFDTDSIIYLEEPSQPNPSLGDYRGEFTNELEVDDYIAEFMSGGPKNCAALSNSVLSSLTLLLSASSPFTLV